jgi:acetyltransferase-like isoleucine patch superfamily enzyme
MIDFFEHPNAVVESRQIGKGSRFWAFAHVLPGAHIGEDCNICEHTLIESDVIVGNRVTVSSGVQLAAGVTLEDGVFVGPGASFSAHTLPDGSRPERRGGRTLVRRNACIGANAFVLPGLSIGPFAEVRSGAVVTEDVPAFAIVAGSPAHIAGYVHAARERSIRRLAPQSGAGSSAVPGVGEVRLITLPFVRDLRGSLTHAEYAALLPFTPQRFFLVFDVPNEEVRGEHAHRTCHQFLVCTRGSCLVIVDDCKHQAEVLLDRATLGLYVPPMIWAVQHTYSRDAMLLVLASEVYRAEDYIRDYDEFLRELGARAA